MSQNGCRLFVGNLVSEATTKEELRSIFERYGSVKEVVLHRSFGFVQFTSGGNLRAAMDGEQGRLIGGKPIDLEPAKTSSELSRGGRNFRRDGGGGGRYGSAYGRQRSRSRSRSPRGRRGRRERERERSHWDEPPPEMWQGGGGMPPPGAGPPRVDPPRDGIVVKILLLGENQRPLAIEALQALRQTVLPSSLGMLNRRPLVDVLCDYERNGSRYALVVGKQNDRSRTVTLKMLFQGVRSGARSAPTMELNIVDAVNAIIAAERELGFEPLPSQPQPLQQMIMAPPMPQQQQQFSPMPQQQHHQQPLGGPGGNFAHPQQQQQPPMQQQQQQQPPPQQQQFGGQLNPPVASQTPPPVLADWRGLPRFNSQLPRPIFVTAGGGRARRVQMQQGGGGGGGGGGGQWSARGSRVRELTIGVSRKSPEFLSPMLKPPFVWREKVRHSR